ncbi:MAG: hypothetical protein RIM99_20400 [Cyclobacteriaceae bacterium]
MIAELNHSNTLSPIIDQDKHVNYKDMVLDAIKVIEKAGGKNWTNYNSSDPGRTILDILCYALLDLGYKTNFPIEDLLANKHGEIETKNRLLEAEQVLFTNPVTLPDFRKLIIDRTEAIKNCWVEAQQVKGAFQGSYLTFYELNDDLKISLIQKGEKELSSKRIRKLDKKLKRIRTGINGLLYQHRNLGDLFFSPTMLKPVRWEMESKIYFLPTNEAEKEIAWIYFQLNNYWSQYIRFHSYAEMKEKGMAVDEVMDGPRLYNGFIENSNLTTRRQFFDLQELKSLIVQNQAVTGIFSLAIGPLGGQSNDPKESKVEVEPLTSPFFDYTRVAQSANHSEGKLQFFNGDQLIRRIDQVKVNTYYELLADGHPIEGVNFNGELGPKIPKGRHRDIKTYFSIQNLFSRQFGLDVDSSFEGVPKEQRGQIKQLKAYLMIFEQVIADHQSQLANVGKLLSFDNGVKVGDQLCKMYYSKGLYKTPGSRFILKAFDSYKKDNQYLKEHPEKTWQQFEKDKSNAYESFLRNHKNDIDKNISQKGEIMDHLLARHGESYDQQVAPVLNPEYGNYSLAKVEIISSLLKEFPGYSANITRSYFQQPTSENQELPPLFCGLELRLGLLFQLNEYYLGIINLVKTNLKKIESEMEIDIHMEAKEGRQFIVIKYRSERLLRIPFTKDTSVESIEHHLEILQKLVDQTKGFVLIDHQLLLSNLQHCKWSVIRNGSVQKFSTSGKIISEFPMQTAVRLVAGQKSVWANDEVYLRMNSEDNKLKNYDTSAVESHQEIFQPYTSIFLPSWVCKVHETQFGKLFEGKILREGPVYLATKVHKIGATHMEHLLAAREAWLEDLRDVQSGSFGKSVSRSHTGRIANNVLLDFILPSSKPGVSQ